jgi:hypothetical protein
MHFFPILQRPCKSLAVGVVMYLLTMWQQLAIFWDEKTNN